MLVYFLSLSILPLLAIIGCGKSRETAHKKSDKSVKSAAKTGKDGKSQKSQKTQKSTKGKKSAAAEKSEKSAKSAKSGKKSQKSKKATKPGKTDNKDKSGKSVKSSKSGKSAKTATSISGKSGKSGKSSKGSKKERSQKKVNQPQINAAIKADQNAAAVATKPVPKPAPVEMKPLELRTEPKEMTYKANGGIQSFNLINNTNEIRVFKVKCSDNQLYRVHPVYQTIEGGQTGKVEVLRQNGVPKTDKLVIVSVKAETSAGDAKDLFNKRSAQPQHMLAVPLIVDA